jgi:hypothetical protein
MLWRRGSIGAEELESEQAVTIERDELGEEFQEQQRRRRFKANGDGRGHEGANGAFLKDDYDESQRAQLWEVESRGPTNGLYQTDLRPDLGGDADEGEIEDDEDQLDQIIDTNKGAGESL